MLLASLGIGQCSASEDLHLHVHTCKLSWSGLSCSRASIHLNFSMQLCWLQQFKLYCHVYTVIDITSQIIHFFRSWLLNWFCIIKPSQKKWVMSSMQIDTTCMLHLDRYRFMLTSCMSQKPMQLWALFILMQLSIMKSEQSTCSWTLLWLQCCQWSWLCWQELLDKHFIFQWFAFKHAAVCGCVHKVLQVYACTSDFCIGAVQVYFRLCMQ